MRVLNTSRSRRIVFTGLHVGPEFIGAKIKISGSTEPGNDGTFVIVGTDGAGTVTLVPCP